MPKYNSLTIVGHLGRDAELRVTQAGQSITSFSVAVAGYKRDSPTTWFNCNLWGDRGSKLAQYLTKGTAVLVTGEVTLRQYQTKDGVDKASLDVRVNDVQLMGSRDSGWREAGRNRMASESAGQAPAEIDYDEDPPF